TAPAGWLVTHPAGRVPAVSLYMWQARPICLRLLVHDDRAAASRTFWTAGRSRPVSTAMMAMTTSSSISVKALRGPRWERDLMWRSPTGMMKTTVLTGHVAPQVDGLEERDADAELPRTGAHRARQRGRIDPAKGSPAWKIPRFRGSFSFRGTL